MYSIRQVYLDHVGYKDAWYQDVQIPLYDSSNTQNSSESTIISLTNGGGKTTLLSLIFSCFIPDKRQFVQHLQKPNHHFEDYFSHQPGLILLELVSDHTADEMPIDPLIIGQYVTISPTTGEDDRFYFLFTPSKSLSFFDVPSLGNGKAETADEIKRWLQNAQKIESSFFYSRNNQTDWRTKLEEYRELDIWTISKQVDFCRSEGGIDHYINFRSEQDFLKEFFYMTLPEADSLSVREVLSESLQKLKKRPENEKRRRLLTSLKSGLEPFVNDAAQVNLLGNQLKEAKQQASSLYKNLSDLHLEHKDKIQQCEQKQTGLEIDKKNLSVRMEHQKREIEKYQQLKFLKEISALEDQLSESKTTEKGIKINEKELNSATVLIEKNQVSHAIRTIQKSIDDAGAGLGPLQENKNIAAFQYKLLLERNKQKKWDQKESLQIKLEDLKENLRTLGKLQTDKNQALTSLSSEKGKVEALIRQRDDGLKRLTQKKFLSEGNSVFDEKKSLEISIEALTGELKNTRMAQHRVDSELKSADEKINSASVKMGSLRSERNTLAEQLKKAAHKISLLQNNPFLFQITGTKEFDPSSTHLSLELDRFLRRKEDEISELKIQLKNIQYRIEFIEDTGSLLMDENTRKLMNQLKENGVKNPRFYPDYLAELFHNDVKKIQSVILKNPSLYLGILVFGEEELEKVRSLDYKDLDITRPISISVCPKKEQVFTDHSETAHSFQHIILGPSDLSVYDRDRVELKMTELKEQLLGLEEKLTDIEKIERQVQSVKIELDRFNAEYGNGLLELQRNQLKATDEELLEISDLIEKLKEGKQSLLNDLKTFETQHDAIKNKIQEKEKIHYEFKSFILEHEDKYPGLCRNLEQLIEEISNTTDLLTTYKDQMFDTNEQVEEFNRLISNLNNAMTDDKRRLNEIDLPEEFNPDIEMNEALTVEMASEDYQTAIMALSSAMTESGLSDLKIKQESEQKKLKEISEKFALLSEGLEDDNIKIYAQKTAVELASIQSTIRSEIEKELLKQGELKGDLQQLRKEQKAFTKNRLFQDQLNPATEITLKEIENRLKGNTDNLENWSSQLEEITSTLKEIYGQLQRVKAEYDQISDFRERLSLYASVKIEALESQISFPNEISDIRSIVNQTERKIAQIQDEQKKVEQMAENSFYKIKEIVQNEEFREYEGRISSEIINNPFDAECRFAGQHLTRIEERIEILTHEIDKTQQDLDICIDNMLIHSNRAINILKNTMRSARIPDSVTNIGGRHILKMKGKLFRINNEQKKLYLENYVKEMAESQIIPTVGHETGDELTASLVNSIAKSTNRTGTLGIEILKLSTSLEYSPIDQITGSGGESMTAAMLLYQVIAQLRADMLTDRKKPTGGFLLLDNPFAKVTTPQLIEPQVELAKELGYQLIYATAIKDFNAQAYFPHFIQLRKTTVDKNSGRSFVDRDFQHIESSEYTVYDEN